MQEDYDLEDVDNFQPTDFRAALLAPPPKPKKKRKFDVGSCIPEPTYIPWPDDVGKPRQRLAEIKPHRIRHEFVPNVNHLLSTGHKRYSWIIPVNGTLPCSVPLTSAIVVPPDATLEEIGGDTSIVAASQAHGTKDRITWTPADLLLFWLWLRDTRKESITGSISLSFTSMPAESAIPDPGSPSISTAPFPRTGKSSSSSKEKIHYIALYHDAAQSLVLRSYFGSFNTLKMWKVLKQDSKDVMESKGFGQPVVERSVLKNARLLLADESGRGVLIS
ncbi:hypothetical protein FRC05_005911 [Tulasnella sp. 425]|nr:hypothetical protein FRC05_005911 [Tulasnella sp. 425]